VRGPAVEAAELAGCRDVSVFYGRGDAQVKALAGVEMAIAEGEAIALWGPSGSGKTTLLHVLGGLVVPSAGVVLWRGEPLSSLDMAARGRARAAGIAYVFQGSNLLPTFTAYENVAFAASVSERAGEEVRHEPASCSSWSAWRRSSTPSRPSCREERASGWRSPGRWRRSPTFSSATSRPATWIPTRLSACWT
jgi:ABC-type branched-subunit amino acid transport system ATPase component